MGRTSRLLAILTLFICSAAAAASFFQPISEAHRSAALELFSPTDGSFGRSLNPNLNRPLSSLESSDSSLFEYLSLEETYEALRTFEVIGIDKNLDVSDAACRAVLDSVSSPSSSPKDVFYALKVNGVLKCQMKYGFFEGAVSRLQGAASSASLLLDFYHAVGSLVLIKEQTSKDDLHLVDGEGVFRSIKALCQRDGKWRYSSNNPESSTFAAGLALEALAGAISLSSSEIDHLLIGTTKSDILKLFDSIEKYDDGAFYFDEKLLDASDYQGALSTTSSVLRGISAFAAVTSSNLNLPGEKMLGLAKFFLSIGIPGDAKDLFRQVDSLAYLESNRVSIPLIVSLPATVLSLTQKDNLKVKVNTVLGSNAPPLTVKLARVSSSGSNDTSVIESQELRYDSEKSVHVLDALPRCLDVGSYTFVFEVSLHDPEHGKVYATGGQTKALVFLTGVIKFEKAEVAVLDSDLGSIEAQKNLESIVSLSANHLQKLRLSFHLISPLGHTIQPHQAIVKLRHETKVEHIFLVGSTGKKFEIVLDFLGLVEKFFYLSGKYEIQLSIGDAVVENSFVKAVGYIDLDLPEPSEKAPRPPPQPLDPYTRYGPEAEITHIFRSPEKLPPKELSLAFLGLTLLPFFGFLIGLLRLGVNIKNFPSSATPAIFSLLFHSGIAAVLLLYVVFWTKLDLFTTTKALVFFGVFLMFVGHRILSHLSSTSAKIKSA